MTRDPDRRRHLDWGVLLVLVVGVVVTVAALVGLGFLIIHLQTGVTP